MDLADGAQVLVRCLNGTTRCVRFPAASTVTGHEIKHRLAALEKMPSHFIRLITGTQEVGDSWILNSAEQPGSGPLILTLLLRLRGGKGGFGSLLRGAATKAGQKKTSNFDACRDMSGRRLRHVNAEKKLKEWKAGAKERELEKVAEEFLKKEGKKKKDDSSIVLDLKRYREQTEDNMKEVASAVETGLKEARRLGKHKDVDSSQPESKRICLWMTEDEDEDEDEDEMDSDDETDKVDQTETHDKNGASSSGEAFLAEGSSTVLDATDESDNSDSSKADKGITMAESKVTTTSCGELYNEQEVNSTNKTQQCNIYEKSSPISEKDHLPCCPKQSEKESVAVGISIPALEQKQCNVIQESKSLSPPGVSEAVNANDIREETAPILESVTPLQGSLINSSSEVKNKDDIKWEEIRSVTDLEKLGLETLKLELQKRGLKCGGSLSERAGRLYLLKATPIEQLDKRHFAKAK